jgi:hypothetical protein
LPISHIENEAFHRMIGFYDPLQGFPTRQTATSYIRSMAEVGRHELTALFRATPFVAITSDCWTNVASICFLGITAHFLSISSVVGSDGKRRTVYQIESGLLGLIELLGSHTSVCRERNDDQDSHLTSVIGSHRRRASATRHLQSTTRLETYCGQAGWSKNV